jgi:hypothetical protein
MPMSGTISIATVNCQGLATPSKRKDVLNYLKQRAIPFYVYKIHILFLSVSHILNHSGDISVSSIHIHLTQGVCVSYLTITLSLKFIIEKKDCEGNLLALDMSFEECKVTLINIYGPNTDSPQFYENVRNT